ncbi:hypothetical protein BH11VER1_BH11VER1_13260 [soil metagenome]
MERSEQTSPPDDTQESVPETADQLTYPVMSAVETSKIPLWTTDNPAFPLVAPQTDAIDEDDGGFRETALTEGTLPVAPSTPRRQPILSEEQDKSSLLQHGPHTDTSYMVNHNRPPNQRRGKQVGRLLIIMFAANLLMLAAGGLWLYNRVIEDLDLRLSQTSSKISPSTVPNQTIMPAEPIQKMDSSYQSQFAKLESALQEAQTRILNAEEQNRRQAASLEAIAAHSNNSPTKPSPETNPPSTPLAPTDQAMPLQQSELVLLKERNRLTGYADEAIATASRSSYEKLWAALEDPRLANLVHASRSEILRVQNYYLSGSRLEQYQISVADYYPDLANLRDAQLKDDQLIALLSTSKNPWQVRMKSANLLGQRRSTAVGDALVKAIKGDNNLDVVKESTFSFEQMTGYRARIFETASLDAWWKQYNTVPPAPNTPAKKETGDVSAPTKS